MQIADEKLCAVTLEISSDIPYDDDESNPNISMRLAGCILPDGSLLKGELIARSGKIYSNESGEENVLRASIKEELNSEAKANMKRQRYNSAGQYIKSMRPSAKRESVANNA